MMRMTALGLASRPDLLLSVQAHRDDKGRLDKIVEAAKEAAAANAAATTGTALHALTELIDRGEDLPVLPPETVADLEAYRAATADLKAVLIEQFCVQDPLKIGGTPDRVVEYQGKRYIADLKTGSIEYGALKIAMQLAVYARSHTYDVASHKRSPHGADLHRALIIHLPAGQARCELVWVDIMAGWNGVLVARSVRELRSRTLKELTRPFDDTAGFTTRSDAEAAEKNDRTLNQILGNLSPRPLEQQVREASTRRELEVLWETHQDVWSDDLTRLAMARTAELGTTSDLPTAS
jgi:acetoacetate decarboxylase